MVASRCSDNALDARFPLLQLFEINDAATHFKSARGGVILVLHPNIRSYASGEQRPLNLGRRRNYAMHEISGVLQFSKGR